ncbi:MAG TPA: ATP-dependent zinc metalloprotease FtsH [Burkholderiaceae bacterium]
MLDKIRSPQHTWNVGYWVIALLAVMWLQSWWQASSQLEPVPYSEFERQLADGKVAEVVITDQLLTGRLKMPDGSKRAIVATRVEPQMAEWLQRYHVPYRRVVASDWLQHLLSWVVPAAVFFGLWYFMFRRFAEKQGLGGAGFMAIGKSRAKVYVEKDTGVSFADVAGIDEAKDELREIVDFLKDPKQHGRLGARVPKGVLLIGPPGTGKTLLARAVAGEAGVSFFSISGSEFVEMFVGVGAARVRDLFEQARAKAPAIIFIDELDAMGRARGAFAVSGHDEKEQTLNQLLVEMDGFDPASGLVILAATNRPEILDPALLRAGRFDRQVLVDRPERGGRLDILEVHVRKVKLAPDVDLEQVAALTPGFSGADLANLVNEAALAATRRRADAISLADFTIALERIVAGLEKRSRVLNPREREIVAYHEMGHALLARALPGAETVHKVSIIPRGVGALGYTLRRPTEDRYLTTRDELLRQIVVLLGGRAAENLVFGHWSTGAADDLSRATEIARDMVTRYGMEEALGHVAFQAERSRFLEGGETLGPELKVSPATQQRIDEAVRAIVGTAFERAIGLLAVNRAVLERGARALLERETLDEPALRELSSDLRADIAEAGSRPAAAA